MHKFHAACFTHSIFVVTLCSKIAPCPISALESFLVIEAHGFIDPSITCLSVDGVLRAYLVWPFSSSSFKSTRGFIRRAVPSCLPAWRVLSIGWGLIMERGFFSKPNRLTSELRKAYIIGNWGLDWGLDCLGCWFPENTRLSTWEVLDIYVSTWVIKKISISPSSHQIQYAASSQLRAFLLPTAPAYPISQSLRPPLASPGPIHGGGSTCATVLPLWCWDARSKLPRMQCDCIRFDMVQWMSWPRLCQRPPIPLVENLSIKFGFILIHSTLSIADCPFQDNCPLSSPPLCSRRSGPKPTFEISRHAVSVNWSSIRASCPLSMYGYLHCDILLIAVPPPATYRVVHEIENDALESGANASRSQESTSHIQLFAERSGPIVSFSILIPSYARQITCSRCSLLGVALSLGWNLTGLATWHHLRHSFLDFCLPLSLQFEQGLGAIAPLRSSDISRSQCRLPGC